MLGDAGRAAFVSKKMGCLLIWGFSTGGTFNSNDRLVFVMGGKGRGGHVSHRIRGRWNVFAYAAFLPFGRRHRARMVWHKHTRDAHLVQQDSVGGGEGTNVSVAGSGLVVQCANGRMALFVCRQCGRKQSLESAKGFAQFEGYTSHVGSTG